MRSIDIIIKILGFLFGGIGVVIITGLYKSFVLNYFPIWGPSKGIKKKNFIGHYESYHLMTSGENEIVKTYIRLYPNILGQIKIRANSYQYNYKGILKRSSGLLYLFFKGIEHDEFMLWILSEPLTYQYEILAGTLSAITEKRIPVAARVLIKKIDVETSPELIRVEDSNKAIKSFLEYKENPLKARQPHKNNFNGLENLVYEHISH